VCLPIAGYLQDSESFIYFCDDLWPPLTGTFPLVLFPQYPFLHFITSSISGYFLTVELTDWMSQLMNSYSSAASFNVRSSYRYHYHYHSLYRYHYHYHSLYRYHYHYHSLYHYHYRYCHHHLLGSLPLLFPLHLTLFH
jgi:hypothetical protein